VHAAGLTDKCSGQFAGDDLDRVQVEPVRRSVGNVDPCVHAFGIERALEIDPKKAESLNEIGPRFNPRDGRGRAIWTNDQDRHIQPNVDCGAVTVSDFRKMLH